MNEYHFKGFQLVRKKERGVWYELETPCDQCGECCKRVWAEWWLGVDENGHCKYLRLEDDGKHYCRANDIPFGCRSGDESGKDFCSVKWRKQLQDAELD